MNWIDLDEVERGAGTFFPEDLAELTWRMVAELRAAREVVEFARYVDADAPDSYRRSNAMAGLRSALRAYDQAVNP